MKRNLSIILALVMLLSIFAGGCGTKQASSEKGKSTESKANESKESKKEDPKKEPTEKELEKAMNDLDKAMKEADQAGVIVSADKKKWPVKLLPSGMPEYSKGKIFAWNGNEKECLILIHETSKDDLKDYIKQLTSKGWVESSSDRYSQPPYYAQFQFNTNTVLQISVHKEDVFEWPKDKAPDVPALTAGVLTQVHFDKEYPENLQLYYEGLKEDKIGEYGKLLVSKGFTEDGDKSYTKNGGTLNGKKYSKITIWFENNGTDEWMVNLTGE